MLGEFESEVGSVTDHRAPDGQVIPTGEVVTVHTPDSAQLGYEPSTFVEPAAMGSDGAHGIQVPNAATAA